MDLYGHANNKQHAEHTIPSLLLSVITKMKESSEFKLDAKPSSDLDISEHWPLASVLPIKRKIMSEKQKVLLRPLVTKKVVIVRGRAESSMLLIMALSFW